MKLKISESAYNKGFLNQYASLKYTNRLTVNQGGIFKFRRKVKN